MNEGISIFRFRRDLRLEDNTALYYALKSGLKVMPVYIFDINITDKLNSKSDIRLDFIHHRLNIINSELKKYSSNLIVIYNSPLKAFEYLCGKYNVKKVFFNKDYEPYDIRSDVKVKEYLEKKEISVNIFKDRVIFEEAETVKKDGTPYTIFTPYSKIWKQNLDTAQIPDYKIDDFTDNFVKIPPAPIPELSEIGFTTSGLKFSKPIINKEIISNYNNTRNYPAIEGTSRLSTHLRFGTISIRTLVKIAKELNETFLNELIWREFFMSVLFHFPYVEKSCFKRKYENIEWRNNEEEFETWCKGHTGFPIVDAGMRELNSTGYMHNRVRMITAGFLTKSLLIDWRWGEAYFAEKLLDYELSSNNGNWQWAAGCGCDAAPYFRIFNPTEQAKRFDPDNIYINKWIPEVNTSDYPSKIIDIQFARNRAIMTYKKALL